MKYRQTITQDQLKAFLNYDEETGVFTWKKSKGRAKAGSVAGGKNIVLGYWQLRINNQLYWAHRLAWLFVHGELPNQMIDHINQNKADNRISNLRICENGTSDNMQNRSKAQKNNSTGVLGVHSYKATGRFVSSIQVKGKTIHLGYFDTVDQAAEAYAKAKAIHHQFAPALA